MDDGSASMSFSKGSSSGGSVGLLVESMDGAGALSVAVGAAKSRVADTLTVSLVVVSDVVCGASVLSCAASVIRGAPKSPPAIRGPTVSAAAGASVVSKLGARVEVTTEAGGAADDDGSFTLVSASSSATSVAVLAGPVDFESVPLSVLLCVVGSAVGCALESGHGSAWCGCSKPNPVSGSPSYGFSDAGGAGGRKTSSGDGTPRSQFMKSVKAALMPDHERSKRSEAPSRRLLAPLAMLSRMPLFFTLCLAGSPPS